MFIRGSMMNEAEKKNKELLEEVEKLKRQVKILKARKKYGLVFEEEREPEQIVLDCQVKIPILKEAKSKEIISDKEKPVNVLIEGDNYHALSVLNYTHKKKIDVIYIDPPYNTGAKDWKYNNNYVDINDLYSHSKWLNFMEKRLRLAKNLLKQSGVLICTIDENEHATLGLLLQELFPDKEIVGVVIIHNPAGVQGKNFSYVHEFAYFVYSKNGVHIGKTTRDKELVSPLRDWGGTSARKLAKTCFYPIIVKNNKIIGFGDICPIDFHPKQANIRQKDGSIYVYPIDKSGIERKWVFSRTSTEERKDELFCKKLNGDIVIMRRKNIFTYRTVWDDKRYYANIYGSKLLNNIISVKFPFPKSLYAVEDCIKAVIHNKNNATILDFFAGSGTTGHAVLELNKEDGGKRQFILCTNNEDNNGDGAKIATDMCYPRIKNVIKGYVGITDKRKYEGLGGNLRYFKTELLDIDHISHVSDEQKIRLTYRAGEMIALREGAFIEVEKDDWWQIFRDGTKYTAIYFKEDKKKLNELVNKLSKLKEKVVLYIFSWGKNEYKNEFTEYKNIKVEDIPEPIIDVYKEVNRLS